MKKLLPSFWGARKNKPATTFKLLDLGLLVLLIAVLSGVPAPGLRAAPSPTLSQTTTDDNWNLANPSSLLYGVDCPEVAICYAAGDKGVIIKSIDAGRSWKILASGTTERLTGVSCPTRQLCLVTGASQGILVSGNGGQTWAFQGGSLAAYLSAVSCASPRLCVAVGKLDPATNSNGNEVVTSDNGGQTWTARASGTTFGLAGVSCVEDSTCYAVGNAATILKTTDSGQTWASQLPAEIRYQQLRTVDCFSPQYCVAGGGSSGRSNSITYATTNGGQTWELRQPGELNSSVSGVSCPAAMICYMVTTAGSIEKSTDGGLSWVNEVRGDYQRSLYAVSCPARATCAAVGNNLVQVSSGAGGSSGATEPRGYIYSNTLPVIENEDDGSGLSPGTFSYALARAQSGQTIRLEAGQIIRLNTSVPLQPLQPQVALVGSGCSAAELPVEVNFQGEKAGLILQGGNLVQGVKLTHIRGTGLRIDGPATRLECAALELEPPITSI